MEIPVEPEQVLKLGVDYGVVRERRVVTAPRQVVELAMEPLDILYHQQVVVDLIEFGGKEHAHAPDHKLCLLEAVPDPVGWLEIIRGELSG